MKRYVQKQARGCQILRVASAIAVIGGRSSASGLRLTEIYGENCFGALLAENAEDLDVSALSTSYTVGITAGA